MPSPIPRNFACRQLTPHTSCEYPLPGASYLPEAHDCSRSQRSLPIRTFATTLLLALAAVVPSTLSVAADTPTPHLSAPSAQPSVTSSSVAPAAPAATAAATTSRSAFNLPGGFAFIYDMDGRVSLEKGNTPLQSKRKATLLIEQPIHVRLERNASIALVFSNGTAMWAKGPGNFTIQEFAQQPFQGNSRQNAYEPTHSALSIDLGRGTFSFAERQLSALSSLRLNFGEGHVLDAQETAAFVLQIGVGSHANEDRVSVLNGRALLNYGSQAGSAVLIGSGQYLQLERNATGNARGLRLPAQLTTEQSERDQRLAHHAQTANDRIWFIREPGSASAQAQIVVPVNFWLTKPYAATRIR